MVYILSNCIICGKGFRTKRPGPHITTSRKYCSSECRNLARYGRSVSELRNRVISLRKSDLCMSSSDIARKVGVSRERVRQILSKRKLSTSKYIQKDFICNYCGNVFHIDN